MRTHSLGFRIPPHMPVTINGLAFESRCVQGNAGLEDCLFLNIFTPFLPESTKSKKLKPVLFWIHGGGLTGGQGSDGIYDGGNMASRSDVVVIQSITGVYFLSISIPNY